MLQPEIEQGIHRYPLGLIPFHALKEAPVEIKVLVADYFANLQTHKLLRKCLHDVIVNDLETFIAVMATAIVFLIIDRSTQKACGHVSLNGRYGNTMLAHFNILPAYWGDESQIIGKAAVAQVARFKSSTGFRYVSQLFGVTPVTNRLAIRFSQKILGFKPLAEVPDMCFLAYENRFVPGVLSIKDLGGYDATV